MDSLSKPELSAERSDPDPEAMHRPVIEAPHVVVAGEMFPVTVKVGKSPHVMEAGHYIQFTDLYDREVFLARVTFAPVSLMPKFTCFLVLNESTQLRAVTSCSLDGCWEAEHWIQVD